MAKDNPSDLIRAKDVSLFDRWSLPSFDPQGEEEELPSAPSVEETVEELARSEDVPVEEVKPLTLDELEAIRQQAYNEGFATGEKDGFHAGQLKARQEAEASLAPRLQSLERLMEQDERHQIEQVGRQLRGMMPWIASGTGRSEVRGQKRL